MGIIIGAQANGKQSRADLHINQYRLFCSKVGYRLVMLVALVFMVGCIFIPFFASSVGVLLVGEILCGIPWGVFTTVGAGYSSEVCPLVLRGYLMSYINLSFLIGQFISAGVLDGLVHVQSEWSYRIPFAVQWIWPVPLFCFLLFAPESPWWLVRNGKLEEAERSVRRLSSKTIHEAKEAVAMMIHTTNYEKEIQSGTTYLDCFKGINLRRTEIACVVFVGQVTCGIVFANSATYFFEQAGISPSDAYKVNLGSAGLGFIATILGTSAMTAYGRRNLYVAGQCFMTLILFVIGFLALPSPSSGIRWAQVALTLVWVFTYQATTGPVAYAISSEISAVRLRVKTVCLAKNTHNITNIIAGVIEPYMINPTEGNWKGKTSFFWAGNAALTSLWAFYRVPETKGRTYEELDILFASKVSARNFKGCAVDAYAQEGNEKTTTET